MAKKTKSENLCFAQMMQLLLGNKRLKAKKVSDKVISMTYSKFLQEGCYVVFLKEYPKIRTTRLRSQWRTKQFGKVAHVVPMRSVLVAFPNTEAYSIYGNKVSISDFNLDKYFCVYSGVYELVNCSLHPGKIDLDIYVHDFTGNHPLTEIKQFYSGDWDEDEVREYEANAGLIPYGQFSKMELLKECFGLKTDVAEYVLSFSDDSFSKKRSVCMTYNESHAQRGIEIFKAIMMNFNGAEEMKRRELLEAVVYAYGKASDEDKAVFARNMKLFMATMADDLREQVLSLVQLKDYEFLKTYVNQMFVKFCKEHTSGELAGIESGVDEQIVAYMADIRKKLSQRMPQSGYAHEIVGYKYKRFKK